MKKVTQREFNDAMEMFEGMAEYAQYEAAACHLGYETVADLLDDLEEAKNCEKCGGPIDEHGLCFECE